MENYSKCPQNQTCRYNRIDPKKIFIIPDMTQLEREKELELRSELKNIRSQHPLEKYIIKKGKILKVEERPPEEQTPTLEETQNAQLPPTQLTP